jgi:Xaa-Pro aminopeptidase
MDSSCPAPMSIRTNTCRMRRARRLEAFRQESGKLRDISFPRISAFGPHAASPHDRCYTHDRSWPTDARDARPLHARAERSHRNLSPRLSGRHIQGSDRRFCASISVGGRPRFRSRYRPWRRRPPLGSRGTQRISKIGHVALEPGMILSNEPAITKPASMASASEILSSSPRGRSKAPNARCSASTC